MESKKQSQVGQTQALKLFLGDLKKDSTFAICLQGTLSYPVLLLHPISSQASYIFEAESLRTPQFQKVFDLISNPQSRKIVWDGRALQRDLMQYSDCELVGCCDMRLAIILGKRGNAYRHRRHDVAIDPRASWSTDESRGAHFLESLEYCESEYLHSNTIYDARLACGDQTISAILPPSAAYSHYLSRYISVIAKLYSYSQTAKIFTLDEVTRATVRYVELGRSLGVEFPWNDYLPPDIIPTGFRKMMEQRCSTCKRLFGGELYTENVNCSTCSQGVSKQVHRDWPWTPWNDKEGKKENVQTTAVNNVRPSNMAIERSVRALSNPARASPARNSKRLPKPTDSFTLGVVSLDCEMVGAMIQGDSKRKKDLLARVTLVDKTGVLLDSFVAPNKGEYIFDYRTTYSGIREENLIGAPTRKTIKVRVEQIIKGRLLVGHTLRKDLQVLAISHPPHLIRDISYFPPFLQLLLEVPKTKSEKSLKHTPSASHPKQNGKSEKKKKRKDEVNVPRPGLKFLSQHILSRSIQEGEHDSVEDARAALDLYLKYRVTWDEEMNKAGIYFTDGGIAKITSV